MSPFYITKGSYCTVVYARSEDHARRLGRVIFDTHSYPEVRTATEADIQDVLAMGGKIHGAKE